MFSFDIDFSLTPDKPQLYLYKPDKITMVAKLKHAYNIVNTQKFFYLNELTFDLPLETDINHVLTRLPYIDSVRHRYLVKYVLGDFTEWYIIDKPNDKMDSDKDYRSFQCFSLEYELKGKYFKQYQVVSYNANSVLTDTLTDTIWTISYINPILNNTYRSFDVTNTSKLDFIYQIADTFNAIVIFDSTNRTVSLYLESELGEDTGLKFDYGRYLQTLDRQISTEEFATHLRAYGNNGLTIQEANPTGENFIFDYSYFLYPFERSGSTVITSSYYMSDSLCNAILDYEALLTSKKGIEDIAETGTTSTNIKITAHGLVNGVKNNYQKNLQMCIYLDKCI